ncbi:MAG: ABC transporter substrate-binding protein [Candidatus Omnitrophota bacterium]|nr:ABC transporter substrate-binding protein [Candidatus Omnitrophota bacterium]
MKRIAYLAIFFWIIAIYFFGCTHVAQQPKLVPINIAFQKWVGYGPFYLADEKGFFKDEGIKLLFVDEQLDSARRDAFIAGMLDCEAATLDLLISKVAQNAPLTAVMKIDYSYGADAIVANQDIAKLEDLADKKISLARDDVGDTFVSTLFYKKVILPYSAAFVFVRPEEAAKTFLNGESDACATWEPYVSEALKKPGAHIIASTREYPGIIVDTLNVRNDLIKKEPAIIKKLLRGWFRAVKYYNEHPDESSRIIAKYFNISPEQYRKQVTGLKWYSYEEQKTDLGKKEWADIAALLTEVKLLNGRIPRRMDNSRLITYDFVDSLYEDSK